MDYFNVCIQVFEATELPRADMSTLVGIQVGAAKKYTNVVKKSSHPHFNEYFVFDLNCTFNELLNTVITFSLFEGRQKLRGKRLVGCISLDIATVWNQQDRVLRKWLTLVLPSDAASQAKGFVKCEISLEAGEAYKQIPQLMTMEAGNILGGYRGRYMIQVYRCVGLDVDDTKRAHSQVSITASYAGNTGNTSKRNFAATLEWNEQITFIELFPPLFQKITITVNVGKYPLVTRDFFLPNFMHISNEGFLPTYGPTYVHMYSDKATYRCSILMAISSEIITTLKFMEKLHGVTKQTIMPLTPGQYGKPDSFFVCGVLFDVLFTDKKIADSDVTFSISFGGVCRKLSQESGRSYGSKRIKAVLGEGNVSSLVLNENKPCVTIQSEWPDTRHRLSNSNILYKLAHELRERVNFAQDLIARGIEDEAKSVLKSYLNEFQTKCLKIPSTLSKALTLYDLEKLKLIAEQLKIIASTNLGTDDVEQLLLTSNSFLSIIDLICENFEDSLPNLIVTFNVDQKSVGYYVMHPREVMYSRTDVKRGLCCGKINSIILKSLDEAEVGKCDVWLWLGFFSQVSYCIKMLPPGHQDLKKVFLIPPTITYNTNHKYTVICKIFGGHIVAGMDDEGLCDSKVSIMVCNRVKQTKVYKRSLVPHWRETLVFNDVRFYPTPIFLKENPPLIILQLLSVNPWPKPTELIGSATITPNVRLHPITEEAEYNLVWISLGTNAQVLAAFEIVQITDKNGEVDARLSKIMPQFVDLPSTLYKVEVVFWGIRPTYVRSVINIISPEIMIQFNSKELRSGMISIPHLSPNFPHTLHSTEVELPDIRFYSPPFVLRVVSPLGFVGFHVIRNVNKYVCDLPSKKQRISLTASRISLQDRAAARHSTFRKSKPDLIPLIDVDPGRRSSPVLGDFEGIGRITMSFSFIWDSVKRGVKSLLDKFTKAVPTSLFDDEDEDEKDWWTKYHSGEMIIYKNGLEKEFDDFSDVLKTYDIEQNKDGRLIKIVKVKIMICLYKWPVSSSLVTPEGEDPLLPSIGVLKQTAFNEHIKLLLRVYCVRAYDLHPCDSNGKSDPYIEIATQTCRISDTNNFIPKELNPVFGKCLELTASFPIDTQLVIRVMDWDRVSAHDLIGETLIDIENRFYSKHRGACGLSKEYNNDGFDRWRDIETPCKILERLCNIYNLPLPKYYEKSVVVGSREFIIQNKSKNVEENENRLALKVLNGWKDVPIVGQELVPEHIERRPLFNKGRPGAVQGILEMWVDMFELSQGSIPPAVDIKPRAFQPYELRVIIWNTAKIPLVDDSYFVGRKHTDIFVKGWLGEAKSAQSTDIHYTSINGEGHFNWRFIFPILYSRQEKKMVVYKKGRFEISKAESRITPEIVLQVWDSDRISSNDFIGSLSMDITQMPVGLNSIGIFSFRKRHPKNINLFKVKKIRGWWPFSPDKISGLKSAGYVEAEFQLLTAEEALASPAGLGRSEPSQLPPPFRPEFRSKFWLAPFRILSHLICANKLKLLLVLLVVVVVGFFLVAIYSIPFLVMKKILGA